MGDPKHQGKKYDTPSHPWQEDRMETETRLIQRYGLASKEELWKAESKLRKYRRKARELLAQLGGVAEAPESAERESEDLLNKMQKLGLLNENESLDDILGLEVRDILDRRLQSVVYKQGLAKTPKQARQMVVHGHVQVDGRKTTIPSYKVSKTEQNTVDYKEDSPFAEEAHPEAA